MRLETQDAEGHAVAMGTAPVEDDGSFFVKAPADRPIRFALLDAKGRFCGRSTDGSGFARGEQRICVGCHAGPERASENRVPAVLLRTTTPVDLTGIGADAGRGEAIECHSAFSIFVEYGLHCGGADGQRATVHRGGSWLASEFLAPKSTIRFEDASAKAGINFTHSFGSANLGSLLEGTGAGCVWIDYNNSGRPSLYVVNGRPLDDSMHPYPLKDKPAPPPHNHLYRNDGNGHFTDVTEQAGLNPDMYSIAVTAADYDNDGFEDLLVTGYGKAVLYHNDGNGHFTDVTEKAGIKVDGWAISSTWLDYDKDGCVDLFVGRYVKFDPKYRAFYAADNYPGPLDYEGETNMLFHNNCDGTFTDVTEKSGIGAYVGRTMGVTAADFDNDGWDDIYVANDRTENFLFHNKHDGTFEEIANDTGTAFGQNGESTSSMGPVFADFEGRGVLDLWVTDGHYNRLLA